MFQAPDRNYSELEDSIDDIGLDIELPISFLDSVIKAGYSDYERSRESEDRLFRFGLQPSAPNYIAWMTPQQLFRETQIEQLKPNWILMNLQPHDCIRMEMQVKKTGLELRAETTRLDASYCGIGQAQLDAYEALLLDVIDGDHSLFLRYDEVSWAWKVVDPILKKWSVERDFIPTYTAGSWGPAEADRLFVRDDQRWRNLLEDEQG